MTQEPRITLVVENKRSFLDLLLLADEQEDMIGQYLDRGDLFVMEVGDSPVAVCVVTDEGDGVFEIQNLAVRTDQQRCGYGSQMLQYVADHYRSRCRAFVVGTGDSPHHRTFLRALWVHDLPPHPTRNSRRVRPPDHREWHPTHRQGLSHYGHEHWAYSLVILTEKCALEIM